MADEKRVAGRRAAEEVQSGMSLGLGTGSTVAHFLDALGERLEEGTLSDIRGVPTSERTAAHARRLNIPVAELSEFPSLDLCVDGADEVDGELNLIKGLGGALLREKMVAQAANRLVIIADSSKKVPRLGTRSPLPVEVVPFAWDAHLPAFRALGSDPVLRLDQSGQPYSTDNNNHVVDLHFPGGIGDPMQLDRALAFRAGVVASGLFLAMTDMVILGRGSETEIMRRSGS